MDLGFSIVSNFDRIFYGALKVMSLDELGDAANAGPKIPMGKMIALDNLGEESNGLEGGGPAVPLDDLAKTPKKVMALDDLGDVKIQVGPVGPGAPLNGAQKGPKMVALEELGNEEPQVKMVALEELGKESNGKKVVKLEDLGQAPAAAAHAGHGVHDGHQLFPRSSRTGRKRTLDSPEKLQQKEQQQLAEEVKEEVDPEEDETKAQVRVLLASWALANQHEEPHEAPKESHGESDDESEQDDQPIVTSQEKKTSRWQRMKNLRSSLEWRKPKKEDKKDKKAVADEDGEGQEESVQALLGEAEG